MRTRAAMHVLIAATATVSTVGLVPGLVRAVDVPVVFVVNSTADTSDAGANGVCQTAVAGPCTLRAALMEAQTAVAPVTVRFDIPGAGVRRINVSKQLPVLNNTVAPVTIDGFSQPGSLANTDPLADNAVRNIELVGTVPVTTVPSGVEGLIILSRRNVVRGLVMHGFLRAVRMTGTGAVGNQLVGNIFGLKPNGDFDDAYRSVVGAPCIDINNGASSNRVGMTGIADRNVISGCFEKGVTFYNQFTYGNFVQNNIIGMDPTGLKRRGNKSMGIDINWSTNWTLVGGTGVRERNLISGNQNSGVEISHGTGTVNNMVVGNFIGTDPTGTDASVATKNLDVGVRLEGAPDCGIRPCPPDASRETVSDNVIVNSGWGGILVDKGIHDSVIKNNRIGITTAGKIASNTSFGIAIHAGASHITVGPGNTIAGRQPGITMSPFGADPVSNVATVTQYNTFTQNSIITTSGLGIDFLPKGSVNQNGSGDANLNERIDVPVLYVQAAQIVATTCATCTVELFATTAAVGTFGPGNSYLASVVADGNGFATFAIPTGGWPPRITATTTTAGGSTSEFAANVDSAVVSVPGPPAPPVTPPVPPPAPPAPAPPAPPPPGPAPSVQIDAITDGADAGVPAMRFVFPASTPNKSAITSYRSRG